MNDLKVMPADKGDSIVIIKKRDFIQKVYDFLSDNDFGSSLKIRQIFLTSRLSV
jgi:hypothetical protein